jgi:hypothetical protein
MPLPLPYVINDRSDVQGNFDAISTQFPIGAKNLQSALAVSALPTAPINGQEIYYVADATNGVVWHLKYRAASASAYKWELVGGPPLVAVVDTAENVNSAVFANPATAGPDLTTPLAGDWDIEWEAQSVNGAAPIVTVQTGVNIAGAAPPITLQANVTLNAANHQAMVVRHRRVAAVAAASLVRLQYASGPAQVVTWSMRRLTIRPVRVG